MAFIAELSLVFPEYGDHVPSIVAVHYIIAGYPSVSGFRMGISDEGGLKVPPPDIFECRRMGPVAGETHNIRVSCTAGA